MRIGLYQRQQYGCWFIKEGDSLTAVGEEVVMSHPRALVYVEAREEVALVIEETGLLEDQSYKSLPPSEHP